MRTSLNIPQEVLEEFDETWESKVWSRVRGPFERPYRSTSNGT